MDSPENQPDLETWFYILYFICLWWGIPLIIVLTAFLLGGGIAGGIVLAGWCILDELHWEWWFFNKSRQKQ